MTPSFHHRPRVGGELTDSYETARVNTPPPTPRRWGDDSARKVMLRRPRPNDKRRSDRPPVSGSRAMGPGTGMIPETASGAERRRMMRDRHSTASQSRHGTGVGSLKSFANQPRIASIGAPPRTIGVGWSFPAGYVLCASMPIRS